MSTERPTNPNKPSERIRALARALDVPCLPWDDDRSVELFEYDLAAGADLMERLVAAARTEGEAAERVAELRGITIGFAKAVNVVCSFDDLADAEDRLRDHLDTALENESAALRSSSPTSDPQPELCPECHNQFDGNMPGHTYGSNWDWVPCQTCNGTGLATSDPQEAS